MLRSVLGGWDALPSLSAQLILASIICMINIMIMVILRASASRKPHRSPLCQPRPRPRRDPTGALARSQNSRTGSATTDSNSHGQSCLPPWRATNFGQASMRADKVRLPTSNGQQRLYCLSIRLFGRREFGFRSCNVFLRVFSIQYTCIRNPYPRSFSISQDCFITTQYNRLAPFPQLL